MNPETCAIRSGLSRLKHARGRGIRRLHPAADEIARDVAGGCRDDELLAVGEQDHHAARIDERARALGDQLEHAIKLRLAADDTRDLGGRLERSHRALELRAPLICLAIEPRVLYRDRRPPREHDRRLLIGRVERAPSRLSARCSVSDVWSPITIGTSSARARTALAVGRALLANRRVTRAGQLTRSAQHAIEDALQIVLGDQ